MLLGGCLVGHAADVQSQVFDQTESGSLQKDAEHCCVTDLLLALFKSF